METLSGDGQKSGAIFSNALLKSFVRFADQQPRPTKKLSVPR